MCPNCGSNNVWVEEETSIKWLRCKCGLMRKVEVTKDGVVLVMNVAGQEAKLPKKGTQTHSIFMKVASLEPATTGDIAKSQGISTSVAASILYVLRTYGLIRNIFDKRGEAGGSTWVLSKKAHRLLGE